MKSNKRDISEQRFGRLLAIEIQGQDSTGKTTWRCLCDCGSETVATLLNITNGTTKSCGCLKKISKRREDFSGVRFGMLVALKIFDGMHWECKCDCGCSSVVATVHLKRNHTRSCGCLRISPAPTKKQLVRRGRNALAGWAQAVKAEAHGVCDCCGAATALHAHHIMPFAVHPSLSAELDNGAALCHSCHRAVHRRIAAGITPGLALAEEVAFVQGCGVDDLIESAMRAGHKEGAHKDGDKARHYKQKLLEVQA